jgi:hypothetical protein
MDADDWWTGNMITFILIYGASINNTLLTIRAKGRQKGLPQTGDNDKDEQKKKNRHYRIQPGQDC